MTQKKFTRLEGGGIKSTQLIFKSTMSIYQPKANLDAKILFDNTSDLVDPEIMEMPERGLHGNQASTFHPGP